MATKDYSLPLKSTQDFVFHLNDQYKNFNLKQEKFSNAFSESSKNVSSVNRKILNYDFENNNYSKIQKQSHSWNKATKNLSPTFGSIDVFNKESVGKISCSSSTSNSTLSLHIEAYENSTVSGLFDETKKSLKQNGLIRGQLLTDFKSAIQNPFEFPRQQENVKAKKPEVAQYTASQHLLNPNQFQSTLLPLPATTMSPAPLRVLVTGAAGQIGYAVVLQIAKGDVFGQDQPIVLVLLDIPPLAVALEGVKLELQDCALPTLHGVEAVTSEPEGFKDIDYAFLIGAMPRKEGMERKDLLAANVRIFKSQGQALANYSKPNVKVLVVGNPANTNALVAAKYAAGKIPEQNFSAMTRLDHNRAAAQIALKVGVPVGNVKNVTIWGNHSSTQFPDASHAKVAKDGNEIDAFSAVNDKAWIQGDFISTVQKRGAVIIEKRKLSSAMSAAKAACDHMRDWHFGTKSGEHVSMAIVSDGSYGVPKGLVYSFPVTVDGSSKQWKIVQGLKIDEFAQSKLDATTKELEQERDDALAACEESKQ